MSPHPVAKSGAYVNQATSILNQPPELIDLPNEVLVEIFNLVPDESLSTARLVCKKIRDAATSRFAKVYFTERIHVVSPYSIDALVDITEHPGFGEHVKTVAICSVRRTKDPKTPAAVDNPIISDLQHDLYLNGYVKTGRFARRMERVFRNIKFRSGSVAISIYDNPGKGQLDGNANYKANAHYAPNRNDTLPMRCYGWAQISDSPSNSIAYRMVETIEQTVYAARRVKCLIRCLKIDQFGQSCWRRRGRLDSVLSRVLESNLAPLSLIVGGQQRYLISYDSESECLDLERVSFDGFFPGNPSIPVSASYNWLKTTQRIMQLKMAKTWFQVDEYRPFYTPHLRCLELSELVVSTRDFTQDLWSEHIRLFSNLPGLRHCELSSLFYQVEGESNDNDEYLAFVGHGQYPSEDDEWILTFRDGEESIEMTGDDVCEQLKELAYYVASAEAQKVQRIINHGRVDNDVVGIIDEVED